MNYGLFYKGGGVHKLLEKFNVSQKLKMYPGSKDRTVVAKKCVKDVTDIPNKLQNLLKTNTPIIMAEEEKLRHQEKPKYDLYKTKFSNSNQKVTD